jgi:hypothetical protein
MLSHLTASWAALYDDSFFPESIVDRRIELITNDTILSSFKTNVKVSAQGQVDFLFMGPMLVLICHAIG